MKICEYGVVVLVLQNVKKLDPDYAISVCEKCHYKYGHKTGIQCSTGNLANKVC